MLVAGDKVLVVHRRLFGRRASLLRRRGRELRGRGGRRHRPDVGARPVLRPDRRQAGRAHEAHPAGRRYVHHLPPARRDRPRRRAHRARRRHRQRRAHRRPHAAHGPERASPRLALPDARGRGSRARPPAAAPRRRALTRSDERRSPGVWRSTRARRATVHARTAGAAGASDRWTWLGPSRNRQRPGPGGWEAEASPRGIIRCARVETVEQRRGRACWRACAVAPARPGCQPRATSRSCRRAAASRPPGPRRRTSPGTPHSAR